MMFEFALLLASAGVVAQDDPERWTAEEVAEFKEDYPATWHFYEKTGDILILSGPQYEVLHWMHEEETGFQRLPEQDEDPVYLSRIEALIENHFSSRCGDCDTIEKRAEFVREWEKKVLSNFRYTDEGKLAFKDEVTVPHDVILAFAEVKAAHNKRASEHADNSFRAWVAENRDRIRAVSTEQAQEYLKSLSLSQDWAIMSLLGDDGQLASRPFFNAAYEEGYATNYETATRILERDFGIGPNGAVDRSSERMDLLFNHLALRGINKYLEQTGCEADGGPPSFFRQNYTNANLVPEFPSMYRQFFGVHLPSIAYDTASLLEYLDLHEARLTHKMSTQALEAEVDDFARNATPVLFQHHAFVPKAEHLKRIGDVHYWKWADCDGTGSCYLEGFQLADPDDLTSRPLFWAYAEIARSQVTRQTAQDPHDSDDVAAHFRRGRCGTMKIPRTIYDDMRPDRGWGLYSSDATVRRFRLIRPHYDGSGRLDRIDFINNRDSDRTAGSIADLATLPLDGRFDERTMSMDGPMRDGPQQFIVDHYDFERISVLGGPKLGNYFYRVLYKMSDHSNRDHIWDVELPKGADVLIEYEAKRNIPHGPIRAYVYENGRKGGILAEGVLDYGKPVRD